MVRVYRRGLEEVGKMSYTEQVGRLKGKVNDRMNEISESGGSREERIKVQKKKEGRNPFC